MLEKEFRNEDPSGKIIALASLIVSLMGGGALAVKIGLQGLPPAKNGTLPLPIRNYCCWRNRTLLWDVDADAL